jgi:hypothetical protein
MKNKIKTVVLLLIATLMISNCSKKKETNFFAGKMKSVSFDKEYPVTGELVDIDSIGVKNVFVSGRYLIACVYGHPYFLQIYELPDLKFLGNYLIHGQGPNDVIRASAVRDKGYPNIEIDDWGAMRLKIVNIEELIKGENSATKKNIYYLPIYRRQITTTVTFYVNDSCLLVKTQIPWAGRDDVDDSYLKYNPIIDSILYTYDLYNYPVSTEMTNRIYHLADCMKPDGTKIACYTGFLDQIDILDINNPDRNFSVSTNNSDISDVAQYVNKLKNTEEELPDFYLSIPVCTNSLIFAMYRNNQTENLEIHIIDWNGKPVCKLLLDRELNRISFDEEHGVIYGVEMETEKTYKYDVKQYLAK